MAQDGQEDKPEQPIETEPKNDLTEQQTDSTDTQKIKRQKRREAALKKLAWNVSDMNFGPVHIPNLTQPKPIPIQTTQTIPLIRKKDPAKITPPKPKPKPAVPKIDSPAGQPKRGRGRPRKITSAPTPKIKPSPVAEPKQAATQLTTQIEMNQTDIGMDSSVSLDLNDMNLDIQLPNDIAIDTQQPDPTQAETPMSTLQTDVPQSDTQLEVKLDQHSPTTTEPNGEEAKAAASKKSRKQLALKKLAWNMTYEPK